MAERERYGENQNDQAGSFVSVRTKPNLHCQRCGGNILRDYEEYFCLQCGAEHRISPDGAVLQHGKPSLSAEEIVAAVTEQPKHKFAVLSRLTKYLRL